MDTEQAVAAVAGPKKQRVIAHALAGGGSGGLLAILAMILAPHVVGNQAPATSATGCDITRAEVREDIKCATEAMDDKLALNVKCLEERMKGVEDKLGDAARSQRDLTRQITELIQRLPAPR